MQTTRIRSPVTGTKYIVVYRVVNNPHDQLQNCKTLRVLFSLAAYVGIVLLK